MACDIHHTSPETHMYLQRTLQTANSIPPLRTIPEPFMEMSSNEGCASGTRKGTPDKVCPLMFGNGIDSSKNVNSSFSIAERRTHLWAEDHSQPETAFLYSYDILNSMIITTCSMHIYIPRNSEMYALSNSSLLNKGYSRVQWLLLSLTDSFSFPPFSLWTTKASQMHFYMLFSVHSY